MVTGHLMSSCECHFGGRRVGMGCGVVRRRKGAGCEVVDDGAVLSHDARLRRGQELLLVLCILVYGGGSVWRRIVVVLVQETKRDSRPTTLPSSTTTTLPPGFRPLFTGKFIASRACTPPPRHLHVPVKQFTSLLHT